MGANWTPVWAGAFLVVFASVLALARCGAPEIRALYSPGEERVRVPGLGAYGIFDPSFAPDPAGGIWISLSAVDPSYRWPQDHPHTVSTALARSEDGGLSWRFIERLNPVRDILDDKKFADVSRDAPFNWSHEVSTLVYDPRAPESSRWRLFWHRYAHIRGKRRFEYGWIAHKAAANPRELARAPETKLFSARGYRKEADAVGGSPRVKPGDLSPVLRDCLVLTEPSALVDGDSLYLAMFCATGRAAGRIILLAEREGRWSFAGTLLENRRDAKVLGESEDRFEPFRGFSAPELTRAGAKTLLIITPTRPGSFPDYRGCLVMEIDDLKRAELRRRAEAPVIERFISGGERHHRGACAFHEKVAGGIYLSRAYPRSARVFRIFRTGIIP